MLLLLPRLLKVMAPRLMQVAPRLMQMAPRMMTPPEAVADGSQTSKAGKGRRGKTDKGKGKAGKGAGKRKKKVPAEEVSLTKAQEDHYVEWLKENEAIWRRGHNQYHKRHAIWAAYGAEVGLDPKDLEAWYTNKRDIYTKTKRAISVSGSGLASLSDNQAWVLEHFSFYDRVLRAEALQSQPMAQLSRQQGVPGSASQQVAQNLDSDSDHEEPGTSQLETLEKDATTAATQPSAHLRIRRKKKDAEREEEEYVLFKEVRDSIKLNTEALHLLITRPAPTGREIFIDFVSNCLKSMSEEQYQQAVPT
ncbi:MAG: hypothetical protein GY697_14080, partial [Desulfobacterales bacterium]|nr:hypothetical protein [Desulfobacterales bacterium]